MLTNKENQKIKFAKALNNSGKRKNSGYYIIEGFKLLDEALKSKEEIKSIYYSPRAINYTQKEKQLLERILKMDIEINFISDSLMDYICDTVTPQGIMAILKGNITYGDKLNIKGQIWLLAYELQDPGNLGTIIRTADAAGIDGIFLSQGTVEATSPKVVRSTMGSFFHIKILKLENVKNFIIENKKNGINFISTDLKAEHSYYDVIYEPSNVIIVGNEAKGLPDEITSLSSINVHIPIYGKAESLNVGVATGIIIYEIKKQLILRNKGQLNNPLVK